MANKNERVVEVFSDEWYQLMRRGWMQEHSERVDGIILALLRRCYYTQEDYLNGMWLAQSHGLS